MIVAAAPVLHGLPGVATPAAVRRLPVGRLDETAALIARRRRGRRGACPRSSGFLEFLGGGRAPGIRADRAAARSQRRGPLGRGRARGYTLDPDQPLRLVQEMLHQRIVA